MEDLRCYTVHVFYKVQNTKMFNGDIGYVQIKFGYIKDVDKLSKAGEYEDLVESGRKDLAKTLKTEKENIIPISYDEFAENNDMDD